MKFPIDRETEFGAVSTSRRSFILHSVALIGTFSVMPISSVFAEESPAKALNGMQQLAQFLTAKPIDAALAQRAGSALTITDANFPANLLKLADFIAKNGLASVDNLKTTPGFEGDLKTTAQQIISALYLGYAGDPVQLSAKDNVQFVSYTQALTYQLTKAYTPIPSYSRWGTGYWDKLPTTT